MDLGMIGLGRMGGNMTARLVAGGHRVVVFDFDEEAVETAEGRGAARAASMEDLPSQLSAPRVVWVMVPAGDATEETIMRLANVLSPGDAIVDGGNANYRESMRRAEILRKRGIDFLDAGTSGGIWGLKEGYSLMVGGPDETFKRLEPIFQTLAPGEGKGYGRVGPAGAGHFAKMVHNGIEYGLMQAYAEGFQILKAKNELELQVDQVAEIWRFGSVIRSWLLDLTAEALHENPEMSGIAAHVADSGEGRWTIEESLDLGIPAPVITQALYERFRSRQTNSYADRVLATMRNKFGGHVVKKN